jgi:sugar phosphate isomerase/epimerase
MYFLGRTQTLDGLKIEDCFAQLKNAGFDGVELCLEHPGLNPQSLSPGILQGLAEFAENLGLTSNSVSYHANYICDDKLLEQTIKAIELTHDFNTSIMVIGGTCRRTNNSAEWDLMIRRTKELVHVAEANDVILAKEFEPGFIVGCTAELLRMFEEIPSENLQANLDLGHVFLCDPDPIAAIQSLQGKVAHCHIEDMGEGVHKHLVPGEGDIDFSAYFAALNDIDFEGMLGLDLYNTDYLKVSPQALSHLRYTLKL